MKKRGNEALDADRFSGYEARWRTDGRVVNRLLFQILRLGALTRPGAGSFVRLQLGGNPEAERDIRPGVAE